MDSSLHEVWQAAAGSPFLPTVGKGTQFFLAFFLLLIGLVLTGVFALSESRVNSLDAIYHTNAAFSDRSLSNVFVVGVPSSLAIA